MTVDELADRAFSLVLDIDPFHGTLFGVRDRDHAVPELSEEREAQLQRDCLALADELEAATPQTREEEVTRLAAMWEMRSQARVLACRPAELLAHQMAGPQNHVLQWSVPRVTLAAPEHAEQYLERLSRLGGYLDTAAQRLRVGTQRGRTAVAGNVARAVAQIDSGLAGDLSELRAVTYQSVTGPDDFPARRDALLDNVVAPALLRYRQMLTDDILPHARPPDRAGLAHLDGEEETYAAFVQRETSTDLTPEQIHEIGLETVAATRQEFGEMGNLVLSVADPDKVIDRIRNDPGLRCRSVADIVDVSRAAIERGLAEAPKWFKRLPRTPLQLRVMPDDEARHTPAHYLPPSEDGSRPGQYLVNALNPEQTPRPGVETTAFHEGVPGHHFQLALSMELDIPRIRRFVAGNAYCEGWALYAERLADEMGLFSSQVHRLGLLVGESFRACRLVVDTGLHHYGWTRQQAIDYMLANSPADPDDVAAEVDRYVAIPGQALGYMIGRLEFLRLRAMAGPRPVADFHDVVLSCGVLPLSILEGVVMDWLSAA